MISDYYQYQLRLAEATIIPTLKKLKLPFSRGAGLEVGCGHGGVLKYLSEHYSFDYLLGIDLDANTINIANQNKNKITDYQNINFFDLENKKFDFIIMRDVLEHIRYVKEAVDKAFSILNPGGILYITYAPYYSPFGGHQHNGQGFFSFFPWIQLLPDALFFKVLKVKGNSYKEKDQLYQDMASVVDTKLTLKKMRDIIQGLKGSILFKRRYFIRPDYKIKFNLPALAIPSLIPISVAELLSTGEEIVLRKT